MSKFNIRVRIFPVNRYWELWSSRLGWCLMDLASFPSSASAVRGTSNMLPNLSSLTGYIGSTVVPSSRANCEDAMKGCLSHVIACWTNASHAAMWSMPRALGRGSSHGCGSRWRCLTPPGVWDHVNVLPRWNGRGTTWCGWLGSDTDNRGVRQVIGEWCGWQGSDTGNRGVMQVMGEWGRWRDWSRWQGSEAHNRGVRQVTGEWRG